MASAPEDKLADLPSAELVAYLSNSYLKANFEAVARILEARDRRDAKLSAELVAALADLDALTARGRDATEVKAKLEAVRALREKYRALLDAFLPPRHEVGDEVHQDDSRVEGAEEGDEMALTMAEAAVSDTVHRDDSRVDDEEAEEGEVKGVDFIDLSSDEEEGEMAEGGSEEEDEEDTESLSQRIKRIRGDKPGELESGKVDVLGQSNSVGTLGNDQQKSSSARIEGMVSTSGKMASKPEDSKVAAFLQESPVMKTEDFDGGMPKTMLLPSQGPLASSAIQEGSSKIDYCKAGIGGKGRSSDGAPARGVSQPSKLIAETNKTPAAQSSAKCGKKEVGAEKCASLSIPSEEPRITRDVVPFEPCKESNAYVQVKREMSSLLSEITSKWDSEAPVFDSLFDEEICMQGFCALYRQGKLATVDKRDEFRYVKVAFAEY
jgi:hypothetical protein